MIEMVFSMMILGVVLIAFFGIFSLFQKSSAQSQQYADAQQNSRAAVDFITEYLRQAGSGTDYVRGQRFVVHAGPYQCAVNADIDNSQTIGGDTPLDAISRAHSPNRVPPSGTTLYAPNLDFQSPAETVVLTLDSDNDGVVSARDAADEPEEDGPNPNLYVLKRVTYGYDGSGANAVRSTNLALVRGPGAYADGRIPEPLFEYFYDHDDNATTPQVLWGDANGDDKLAGSEITSATPMPDSLLSRIRKIRVTVVSQADYYNKKYEDTDGFLTVEMNSEVFVRNSTRANSVIYGQVFHYINGDGLIDANETGIPNVKVRLIGATRETTPRSRCPWIPENRSKPTKTASTNSLFRWAATRWSRRIRKASGRLRRTPSMRICSMPVIRSSSILATPKRRSAELSKDTCSRTTTRTGSATKARWGSPT
ncbi:MAG: hypothetical protein P8181_14035 [bacterium]